MEEHVNMILTKITRCGLSTVVKFKFIPLNIGIKMDLTVFPIHKKPEYLLDCCSLINSEWKRSETARLRSLESSCDNLPVHLILLKDKDVIGHAKLTPIPSMSDACFVESVVIKNDLRGQGLGSHLMKKVENYCLNSLKLDVIYLSTKGQEKFYSKLGYVECEPITIFGGPVLNKTNLNIFNSVNKNPNVNPKSYMLNNSSPKTYMRKYIKNVLRN